jgi:hypothetical protein
VNSSILLRGALASALLAASAAAQASFNEVEPNETKALATANGIVTITAGDVLVGNTTGTSTITAGAASSDTWHIKTAPLPLAIYRHTLTLTTTGTAGHGGSIRGLNQTSGVGLPGTIGTTDTTLQSTTTTAPDQRTNAWYGFGRGEELYYRVSGSATTTADYNATLATATVSPLVVPGTFAPGSITLQTRLQTSVDTDIHLFDSNLVVIDDASNDDESVAEGGTGATLQSQLTRTLTPGTYYLAIGRFNVATNDNSPATDDFRTGAVLDFPNAILGTSTTTAPGDFDLLITDTSGATPVTVAQPLSERYSLVFVQFTVASPVPPVVVYCTAGTTTNGCNASINANVQPNVGNTAGCVITATNVEGDKQGLIFYGIDQTGFTPSPWGASSSFLCVKSPTQRTGPQAVNGTAGLCDAVYTLNWDAYVVGNPTAVGVPFAAGDKIYAQAWFRDPPSPKTTNLSNAVELTVQP